MVTLFTPVIQGRKKQLIYSKPKPRSWIILIFKICCKTGFDRTVTKKRVLGLGSALPDVIIDMKGFQYYIVLSFKKSIRSFMKFKLVVLSMIAG